MGRTYSDERLDEIATLVSDLGHKGAAKKLGIEMETVRRCMREYRKRHDVSAAPIDDNIMRQIRERFTDDELRKLVAQPQVSTSRAASYDFDGDEVTIGYITDTHIGSVYFDEIKLLAAFETFAKHSVDFIFHTGDVFEGISNRAGHMYECTHIGYGAQLDYGRELFSNWTDTPIYMIDGNHDRWFVKSAGAFIVEELCREQDNLNYLGSDEGDLVLGDNIIIKGWHGGDGNSYAYSYRVQKLIEALTGGEKPNVLLTGHVHKAYSMFCRNIHCCGGGCIERQSKWMRGKRIEAHVGFYIIKIGLKDSGVAWFEPRWFPFYN